MHPAPDQAARLEKALQSELRGEVRFDRLSRTIYSTDASLYEIVPTGVVLPHDLDDVLAAINLCREHEVSIVARGAGTGIAGAAVGWGVQFDFSRFMNRIENIDPDARTAVVQPGVVLDDLNAAAAKHNLHFPPDVATSSRATIGGMIANNSCGSHSVYYGQTVHHVDALRVVLSSGGVRSWRHLPFDFLPPDDQGRVVKRPHGLIPPRSTSRQDSPDETREADALESELEQIRMRMRDEVLRRYPRVLRSNGGYALDRLCMSKRVNPATLLCGSEGTLGLIGQATLRLTPLPRCKALMVIHFGSVLEAVAATPACLAHDPAAVELIDRLILDAGAAQVPEAQRRQFLVGEPEAVLVCELYDDDADVLVDRMAALEKDFAAASIGSARPIVYNNAVQEAVWNFRNKGFGLLMSRPGDRQPYEFIEDAAVDTARLHEYIGELDEMIRGEGVGEVGYYAHASVGVLHVRPVLNLKQPADVLRMRRIADKTSSLALKYHGSMTGEHGDGLLRSEWHDKIYGPEIVRAFSAIKKAFDPHGLFNPHKIVDPLPMNENLRYGGGYTRLPVQTQLDYRKHGGLANLAGMCSGVGQCRQKLVGTMCPSYMATLDERHTTRARANALRSALSNRGLLDGLDDPALDEVMELCLSCKACKTECPTGVDMARMKADWLAHRHARHGVPRSTRFFASAAGAARLASVMPSLANFVLQARPVRRLLESRYGLNANIAPPLLAQRTFRKWFDARQRRPGIRGRVVYFVDTWTNYYWPEPGIAAVRLLEAAGFEVLAPRLACCGRPQISKGLLDEAAALARTNVERLARLIDDDTYIVGSEPSCILTLMDEAPQLVRTDAARRIADRVRTVESLLARVLRDEPDAITFADASRDPSYAEKRVLYHGHCHQKALVGIDDALALLNAPAALSATTINSGCCGMAGSFGHELEHYEVSRAIGEQRLFPVVRERGEAEVVVSGFSCREQITHHCGVQPRHALECIADALDRTASSTRR